MALVKQVITIPLHGGLREDIDPQVLAPPYLSRAENAVFDKHGVPNKRHGATSLGVLNNSTSLVANRLFTFEDRLHALASIGGTHFYSATNNTWGTLHTDSVPGTSINVRDLVSLGDDSVVCPDAAVFGDTVLVAWQNKAGTKAWAQAFELGSKLPVTVPLLLDYIVKDVRIVYAGSGVHVILGLSVSDELYGQRWGVGSHAAAPLEAPSWLRNTVEHYDACAVGSGTGFFLAVATSTGTLGKGWAYRYNSSQVALTSVSTGLNCRACIAIAASSSRVLIGGSATSLTPSNVVRVRAYNTSLVYQNVQTNIQMTVSLASSQRLTLLVRANDGFAAWSAYRGTSGTRIRSSITKWQDVPTSTPGASDSYKSGFMWNYELASKAILASHLGSPVFAVFWSGSHGDLPLDPTGFFVSPRGDAEVYGEGEYVPTLDFDEPEQSDTSTQQVTAQNSGTLINVLKVLGKFHQDTCAAKRNQKSPSVARACPLATLIQAADFTYGMVSTTLRSVLPYSRTLAVTKDGSRDGTIISYSYEMAATRFEYVTGVDWVEVQELSPPVPAVHVDRQALLSAGYLGGFDGGFSYESSIYHVPPTPVPGYEYANSTYSGTRRGIKVLWEWTDDRGNVHRSAPSRETAFNTSTQTNISVYVFNPKYTLSQLSLPLDEVTDGYKTKDIRIRLYATGDRSAGGSNIFTLQDDADVSVTDIGSGYYRLSWNSANYEYGVPLYTESGELSSECPPAFKWLAVARNRVFGISADDPSFIWYSKPMRPTVAVEWSSVLGIAHPEDHEAFTGIAALDDKVILFKERSIYFLTGEGLDALGGGGGFQGPFRIASDTGCSRPRSIVDGPFGVAFLGEKGFYLLDRGLNVKYLGGPVEDTSVSRSPANTAIQGINPPFPNSAVLIPDRHEVRWLNTTTGTTTADCLVWNYANNAWSLHTDVAGKHAVYWNGRYTRLTEFEYVFGESDTEYRDAYENGATYTVSALPLMKVRTPWIRFGNFAGFQRLNRVIVTGTKYGGYVNIRAVYNDGVGTVSQSEGFTTITDSSSGTPFRVMFRPKMPRCTSVRFEIYESLAAPGSSRGFVPAAITLEYGVTPDHRGKAYRYFDSGRRG